MLATRLPLAVVGCTRNATLAMARSVSSSSLSRSHENPLGLPTNKDPPTMPRRAKGILDKRSIPHVRKVVVVSSGKGGVGKSTVSANLALSLSLLLPEEANVGGRTLRVGILDLDIFGPSVPKLFDLERAGEPALSPGGSLMPLTNHGIPTMSMGYLLPPAARMGEISDAPIVWRGLMVQKATQQLLFQVDWSRKSASATSPRGDSLDVLVIDMPPGTGDVALSLTQLVKIDVAVVVSTPQEVALIDARRGVRMFQKVDVPIAGLVLNMSHFTSPSDGVQYPLFGPPTAFEALAKELNAPVLARIPLQPHISTSGDQGRPAVLAAGESEEVFRELGRKVWQGLQARDEESIPPSLT